MIKGTSIIAIALICLLLATTCMGRDVLFRKTLRNYGIEGIVGTVYRREFETRMFTHVTWTARLYCSPFDPDINETLEVYSKPDGSRWLSYRRASPSLGRIISARLRWKEEFDLKKELDAVQITGNEILLPAEVANELQLLWRTMLPGVSKEPSSRMRTYLLHPPNFVGFVRDNGMIKTGEIANSAYSTEAYREFAGIVDDLINVCNPGSGSKESIFAGLSANIRTLRARLVNKQEAGNGNGGQARGSELTIDTNGQLGHDVRRAPPPPRIQYQGALYPSAKQVIKGLQAR